MSRRVARFGGRVLLNTSRLVYDGTHPPVDEAVRPKPGRANLSPGPPVTTECGSSPFAPMSQTCVRSASANAIRVPSGDGGPYSICSESLWSAADDRERPDRWLAAFRCRCTAHDQFATVGEPLYPIDVPNFGCCDRVCFSRVNQSQVNARLVRVCERLPVRRNRRSTHRVIRRIRRQLSLCNSTGKNTDRSGPERTRLKPTTVSNPRPSTMLKGSRARLTSLDVSRSGQPRRNLRPVPCRRPVSSRAPGATAPGASEFRLSRTRSVRSSAAA